MTENDDRAAKAYLAWRALNAKREKDMAKIAPADWKKMKIDPKDVSVQFGPILTEDQFKAYCQETGMNHPVMKMPVKKKS